MPTAGGQISVACTSLVRTFEGCRLTAYLPTPNDRPTIGWGSTFDDRGRPVRLGHSITQAEADAWLDAELDATARQVWSLLRGAETRIAQFDAMVVFAYNIGLGAFAKSTLLRLHRAGDFVGAAAQFGRWNKQGTTVLKGLTRRRAAEAALYSGRESARADLGTDWSSGTRPWFRRKRP